MAGIDVSGYIIPEVQPSQSTGLQHLSDVMERGRERKAALQERQQEFQQRNALAQEQRLKENRIAGQMIIDKELDPNKWDIGEKTFDNSINDKINNLQSKWSDVARTGVDAGLIRQGIQNDVRELGHIYTSGKDDLARIKESKAQLAKDYPDADQLALSTDIDNKFLDTYMSKDPQTGQYANFKPIGAIQSSPTNFLQTISSPEGIAPYLKGTSALDKHIVENTKNTNTKLAANAETNAAGHVVFNGGVGEYSPLFAQPKLDSKGRVIGIEPKKEDFLTGYDDKGNPQTIPMATQDQWDKLKQDKAAFAAFHNYYQQKIPQVASEMSPNGQKPIDPISEEKLQRAAYYHYIKDNGFNIGQYVEHRPQVVPLTKNIFNMGNKETPVEDNYTPLVNATKTLKIGEPLQVNSLPNSVQDILIAAANKKVPQQGVARFNQDNLGVTKNDDGTFNVVELDDNGKILGTKIPRFTGHELNLGGAKGVERKVEIKHPTPTIPIKSTNKNKTEADKLGL